MKRRIIRGLPNQNLNTRQERFSELKNQIKATNLVPTIDEIKLDAFVNWMLNSGYKQEDIQSVATQAMNWDRPALRVSTTQHTPVIDQLLLSQYAATEGLDTAAEPNFAIRHRGNAELLLRRITPGDAWLLAAAHSNVSLLSDDLFYWRVIWRTMLKIALPTQNNVANQLAEDTLAGCSMAMSFLCDRVEHNDMWVTFFRKDSPFYLGIEAIRESRRTDRGYKDTWVVRDIETDAPREEYLAQSAALIAAYGFDHAHGWIEHSQQGEPFYSSFASYVRSHQGHVNGVIEIADQTPDHYPIHGPQ